jgi:hypothetical protein
MTCALVALSGCSPEFDEDTDSGTGGAEPTVYPDYLDFGLVEIARGESETPERFIQSFVLANEGDEELTVHGTSLGGAHPDSFFLLSDLTDLTLTAGEDLLVDVAFEPAGEYVQVGRLTIETSADRSPKLTTVGGMAPFEDGPGGDRNEPPVAVITSPEDGDVANDAGLLELTGVVGDEDLETLSVSWRSNRDGDLGSCQTDSDGTVSIGSVSLSIGAHVLSLVVEDSEGMREDDEVEVVVCDEATDGTLQVGRSGHLAATIVGASTAATTGVSLLKPEESPITSDASANLGVSRNLGEFDACTTLAFRMVTDAGGSGTYDSDNSDRFQLSTDGPDLWTLSIDDDGDLDYDDVIIELEGGL